MMGVEPSDILVYADLLQPYFKDKAQIIYQDKTVKYFEPITAKEPVRGHFADFSYSVSSKIFA